MISKKILFIFTFLAFIILQADDKIMIGEVEKVYIEPGNMFVKARIDTGASTTSLDAQNLQIITKNSLEYVTFAIDGQKVQSKIVKFVRIKQHGSDSQRRPVIIMRLTLGDITKDVKVTLTDRSNFKYKMIIGVNFLYEHFIVDVSRKELIRPNKNVE